MNAAWHRSAGRRLLGCPQLAVGLLAAAPAFAADGGPLSKAKDAMLCYERVYTPAHLARHPRQTVTTVLLAYEHPGLATLVLTGRTGTPQRIAAGCGWTPSGAGIDTSGRTMIPSFKGSGAYECMVTVGKSDEEGGYLIIDASRDAKTATVYIQSPITTYAVQYNKGHAYNLNLGPEDLTFRLPRVDPKPCGPLKATSD